MEGAGEAVVVVGDCSCGRWSTRTVVVDRIGTVDCGPSLETRPTPSVASAVDKLASQLEAAALVGPPRKTSTSEPDWSIEDDQCDLVR